MWKKAMRLKVSLALSNRHTCLHADAHLFSTSDTNLPDFLKFSKIIACTHIGLL